MLLRSETNNERIVKIKVAIVEDGEEYRSHLEKTFKNHPDLRCIGSYRTGEDALIDLPQKMPDVVLMDIHLPGIDGVECVKRLKEVMPQTQFMMLTVFENDTYVFNALVAGATGYLLKRSSKEEIFIAIKELYNGGAPMSAQIARKVISFFSQFKTKFSETDVDELLSKREEEILSYLTRGYQYKEIAEVLFISYDTVRTHIKHIYKKLHVRSRSEAIIKTFGYRKTS
ncbi:MAG: response regulator transcription factor [Bacteroidota bacterium]|nr:response regulator transcription factor [Bacteroidota bacterium]